MPRLGFRVQLDPFVEDDLSFEGAVHLGGSSYLHQARAPLAGQVLGESHNNRAARGGATLSRAVVDIDLDLLDLPPLPPGVELDGRSRAGSKARRQQLRG